MPLEALPIEVLNVICGHLYERLFHKEVQWRTLLAVCLTSRKLYNVAIAHLWNDIDGHHNDLPLFLRSVEENPHLAHHVKHFLARKLEYDLGKAYTLLVERPGLLPKGCTGYLDPESRTALNYCLIEALLPRLSGLEDLSLLLDFTEGRSPLFDPERWKTFDSEKLWPHLKSCTIYNHERNEPNPYLIAHAQYLIRNQKEVKLECNTLVSLTGLETHFPYLRSLSVSGNGMYRHDLRALILACPALTNFEYHGDGSDPDMELDDDPYVHVKEIVELLQPRCATLEELHINFYIKDDFLDQIQDRNTLPDIRHFSKLRVLGIDFELLLDVYDETEADDESDIDWEEDLDPTMDNFVTKLPKSLEKLLIFKGDYELGKGLEGLAMAKESVVPNLKEVNLCYYQEMIPDTPGDIFASELHKANTMLKECGVKLVMSA